MKKKLSIITINYNNLEGLKKTIESIFNQTWKEFEYIIIDGNSTDGSKELLKRHDEQIDYWVSEADSGIYNAMNKGIKIALGEYLLFLNSGDYLANKSVLEIISAELYSCDILYGNLIVEKKNKERIIDKGPNGNEITLNNFVTGYFNHPSAFIKRILFKKYGLYDEDLKMVSDWKFFVITIGLNNVIVKYLDLDISIFNQFGITYSNSDLSKLEREKTLEALIPKTILSDYEELNELKKWSFLIKNSDLSKLEREKTLDAFYEALNELKRWSFLIKIIKKLRWLKKIVFKK